MNLYKYNDIIKNGNKIIKEQTSSFLDTLDNTIEANIVINVITDNNGWHKGDIIKAEDEEIYRIAITDEIVNNRYNTVWHPVYLDLIIKNKLNEDVVIASTKNDIKGWKIPRNWLEEYIKVDNASYRTVYLEKEIDNSYIPDGYYLDIGEHLGSSEVLRKINPETPDAEFKHKIKITNNCVNIISPKMEMRKRKEIFDYYQK